LPIVASDLPSNCDLLKMAGICCSSCEALGFAHAIEELLENRDAYHAASERSYQRSAQLQWHLRAEKIMSFLPSWISNSK
ncbi:MAG: hypothetical protein ACU83O_07615, partial [Gammaproteobacteria bacterium]